jgi:hypothetical protein
MNKLPALLLGLLTSMASAQAAMKLLNGAPAGVTVQAILAG